MRFFKSPFFWVSVCVLAWCFSFVGGLSRSDYDLYRFGNWQVLHNGRIKPFDSMARTVLLTIHGKQSFKLEGESLSPTQWVLEAVVNPKVMNDQPLFRLLNPDHVVPEFLGLEKGKNRYVSFNQVAPHMDALIAQASAAQELKKEQRSVFQKEILDLYTQVVLYQRLRYSFFGDVHGSPRAYLDQYQRILPQGLRLFSRYNQGQPLSQQEGLVLGMFNAAFKYHKSLSEYSMVRIAPSFSHYDDAHEWQDSGQALLSLMAQKEAINPALVAYANIFTLYHAHDIQGFNQEAQSYLEVSSNLSPSLYRKTHFEYFFHHIEPFYKSMVLYVVCFLLVFVSLFSTRKFWYDWSYALLKVSFILHTFGLLSRIYIQGRPPVTNLYSSAVFVGWIGILVALLLERYSKNRLGIIVSSIIGFLTLIVAHHLALTGDTMEMMQAVLDTNFWLATHVVTITIGYSGAFLAGLFAILYILQAVLSSKLSSEQEQDYFKLVFGIVCFALFFSFVGTVLGGIWADQSWGRFWGWDPKENGALLIVIWNALALHMRMGKLIKIRGFMVMAVLGNIVTSLSWFGVNMLGIGLHSYGFMEGAFMWLMLFIFSQLLIVSLALLPRKYWISSLKK